jgi:hypothetical protein
VKGAAGLAAHDAARLNAEGVLEDAATEIPESGLRTTGVEAHTRTSARPSRQLRREPWDDAVHSLTLSRVAAAVNAQLR